MKKVLRTAFLIMTLFVGVCIGKSPASAKIPDAPSCFYVLDEAGVLSPETEKRIVEYNAGLYEECGAQIVVVCVDTTGSEDISDYAYDLFNNWRIGSRQKNNGVLILLSIDEDDYYVLQGSGLEDILSSGTIKIILDEYLEDYFDDGNYDSGVNSVFDAIYGFLCEYYAVTPETGHSEYYQNNNGFGYYGGIADHEDMDDHFQYMFPEYAGGMTFFGFLKSVVRFVFRVGAFVILFVLALIVLLIYLLRKIKLKARRDEAAEPVKENRNPYSQKYRYSDRTQYKGKTVHCQTVDYESVDNDRKQDDAAAYNGADYKTVDYNTAEHPSAGEYKTTPGLHKQSESSGGSGVMPFILGGIIGSVLKSRNRSVFSGRSGRSARQTGRTGSRSKQSGSVFGGSHRSSGINFGSSHRGGGGISFGGGAHRGGGISFGGGSHHGGGGFSRGGGAGRR